jgi:hypothetical protein
LKQGPFSFIPLEHVVKKAGPDKERTIPIFPSDRLGVV